VVGTTGADPRAGNGPVEQSLADSAPMPLWLDTPRRPGRRPTLTARIRCELAVVGGGFTGLWTALEATERNPGLDVVLVDAGRVASAATGRNGGFCDASLTHGLVNGASRFPGEIKDLERMGVENLDEIERFVSTEGVDCGFERSGTLDVATAPWQLEELRQTAELAQRLGVPAELWEPEECRGAVSSPTYLGGLRLPGRCAVLDPARLAWSILEVLERRGVRVFEQTAVEGLRRDSSGVVLQLGTGGWITADHVALATNAFPSPLRRVRAYVLPVYDYVLATEPLDDQQLRSIGWKGREGISDSGNRFHYYRLTEDDRIVFGGYDAIYHPGGTVRAEHEQRFATFRLLAQHFFETFPSLEGVRFTHRWGGAIDTCSRFCVFFGNALRGRVAYAAGFTGLGVGASRFAGAVLCDLLEGRQSERCQLGLVRTKPLPFPPEPLRTGVVALTRWSLARADDQQGSRNAWLRLLDRLGLGFDS
jgi:glycine/D-amino acid oxidase-like deaminating enzyme